MTNICNCCGCDPCVCSSDGSWAYYPYMSTPNYGISGTEVLLKVAQITLDLMLRVGYGDKTFTEVFDEVKRKVVGEVDK